MGGATEDDPYRVYRRAAGAVFWTASVTAILLASASVLRGAIAIEPRSSARPAGGAAGWSAARCQTELRRLVADLDGLRDAALREADTDGGAARGSFRGRADSWLERWRTESADCDETAASPALHAAYLDAGRLRFTYESILERYRDEAAPLRRSIGDRLAP